MPRPTTPGITKPYRAAVAPLAATVGAQLDHSRCGALAESIAQFLTDQVDLAVRAVDARLEYDGATLWIHNELGKEALPAGPVQAAINRAQTHTEQAAAEAVDTHRLGDCEACNPPLRG